jgi:two-component system KDP operon response regulator KdpE
MKKPGILIIDDEVQIRKLLTITLEASGYDVIHAAGGKDGITIAATRLPDMIILDLGLPDENGHNVLLKLREWYNKPIIILSVITNETDIIKALDNGANDYLTKPFRTGELQARIRSALRITTTEKNEPLIAFRNIEIDLTARTVKRNKEIIKLSSTQYALLVLLSRNEGKVLTHHYILKEIWGDEYVEQLQYLRVYIAQLRKKIEANPDEPLHIITESGIGYRFVA